LGGSTWAAHIWAQAIKEQTKYYLPASLNGVGIEDLDPVAVGVLDKGQSLHTAIVGLLHEVNAELLEAVGRRTYD